MTRNGAIGRALLFCAATALACAVGLWGATNPTPVLNSLSPNSAAAGGIGFTLILSGSNFVPSSVVIWNGSLRPTSFVNSTRLTAAIYSADIASATPATVTVLNPAPGGGSSSKTFRIYVPCGMQLSQAAIYKNVPAFSNGVDQTTEASCAGIGAYGNQYQCVEYVKRFYAQALAFDTRRWTGNASTYFSTAPAKGLIAFPNRDSVPPVSDDILTYSGDGAGHVSILSQVTQTEVHLVEQNWSNSGVASLRFDALNGTYAIPDRGTYKILGWLRRPLAHLTISTDKGCPPGISCSGQQGTVFTFAGNGFSPNASIRRFIRDSSGNQTELMPVLPADGSGALSWSFPSCTSNIGTFLILAVEDTPAGRTSNLVTETIRPGTCAGLLPDLTITKAAIPNPVISGGTLTYTITVSKTLDSPVDNVTVVDSLATGLTNVFCNQGACTVNGNAVTASLGTLVAAGGYSFTITATAPTVTSSTTITNTATVSTTSAEANTANNTASQNSTVNPVSPPPVTFMKTIGSPSDDFASSIQKTSDGGFIVAGYTRGLGAGREDVLLIKLDASGAMQWAKTAGTAGSDVAYSVRQTSDGGYIVSGSSDGVTGVAQLLLSKFDSAGAFQWARTLGNPSDSAAGLSVQQTTDGGYIVTGFPAGALGGLGLLKYDGTGQLQWLRSEPSTNHYGYSVQQTSDGGYIVVGNKQGFVYDLSLLKFDGSGNLQWAQLGEGSGYDSGNSVRQTSDGGYIVAGVTASFGAGGQDVLLLKYDGSGTMQWARSTGGSGDDAADFVQQTTDGGYIVSGHTASFGTGQNVLLLKYDAAGTLQWARSGGGSTSSTSVQQTSDGGYLVAGSTASFGAGGSDVLLVRTDSNGDVAGCAAWSSVTPSAGTTFPSSPTTYTLSSPTLNGGAPTFTTVTAPLTSTNICP